MNNFRIFIKYNKVVVALFVANLFLLNFAKAQFIYQPYNFQFNQNNNQALYSVKNKAHTAFKPLLIDDSVIINTYDSGITKQNTWGREKFFSEHLLNTKSTKSTFYADLLPNLEGEINLSGSKNSGLTALGLQFGGTVSNKLSYYGSVSENSETFPSYLSTHIQQTGVIPGQAVANSNGNNSYYWTYVTAGVSYTPNKYLNITAGRDKHFIGDGYRSLLLSDFASPYLFFRVTATLGSLRYTAMWTHMNDPASVSQYGINRTKFGVFHYFDWTVSNRVSIGLFENIIGLYTDDNGAKRPFDFYYLNPLIILKPINNSSADPDKSLLGILAKCKLSSNATIYGQFALNEFQSKDLFPNDGSYVNKYAYQVGMRGNNLFNVKGLNYLVETNNVRPFTYSARASIENYSNNGDPLAHPWGSNFREVVGLLNYQHNRWTFSFEADYGKYGLDSNKLNYGSNIFNIYTTYAKLYGNNIGQGLGTTMIYLEGRVAYILNPKYNLRLEMGTVYRSDKNTVFDDKTSLLTFGLKSSFNNFYKDITSFKVH